MKNNSGDNLIRNMIKQNEHNLGQETLHPSDENPVVKAKEKVSPLPIQILTQIISRQEVELASHKIRESDIIIQNQVEELTADEVNARKRQILQENLLPVKNTESQWAQSERLIQFSDRAHIISQGVLMDSLYRNEVNKDHL